MAPPFRGVGSAPPPTSGPYADIPATIGVATGSGSIPNDALHSDPITDSETNAVAGHAIEKDKSTNPSASSSRPKASSATCIPRSAERIKIDLPNEWINKEIQYMSDHALIGKFLGFWPTEKALHGWIASKWKPKGQVTLQLGPKGFFTAIFNCLEDKTRIFEGGLYFFNSAGLYLRDWKARFNPDKEYFNWAPIWIRMYLLPSEYWNEETLKDIGNCLGVFIKVVEETKNRRYTSYARICVHMHLAKELTDSVSLFHDDYEWIQPIDYEHIPFPCRKCHEHGHLFRDCPLNLQPKAPATEESKNAEGFTRVSSRRKHAKKPPVAPVDPKKPETQNSFETLSSNPILEDHSFIPPLDPSPSLFRLPQILQLRPQNSI